MAVHLIGCIFNIIFDPIMIFGLWGFPAMGVKGAAIATVGGQILSAVAGFIAFYKKKSGIHIALADFTPSKDIFTICKTGIPTSLAMGIASIMSFGMNQILKKDVMALAVFTVFYKLWSFVIMPCNGLIQGTVPIMGYNYGSGNRERVLKGIRQTLFTGIIMMLIVTIIFEIFAGGLVSLFDNGNNGPDFMPACIYAVRIISCIFVFFGFGQISSGIFQGLGNGVPSFVFALLHQCILLLPSAWLFYHFGGMSATWFSFWFAEILSAFVTAGMFYIGIKKLKCKE